MKRIETEIPGVLILEPTVFEDHRGYFMPAYSQEAVQEMGIDFQPIQDNQSYSKDAGTIRGFHYQLEPTAQAKLVRVLSGAILDVVLDLRRDSPTFGKTHQEELSAENQKQVWMPRGTAHAICTLAADTVILYKVDHPYSPELERGIAWDDPGVSIKWPVASPHLSKRDQAWPKLEKAEFNFKFVP